MILSDKSSVLPVSSLFLKGLPLLLVPKKVPDGVGVDYIVNGGEEGNSLIWVGGGV